MLTDNDKKFATVVDDFSIAVDFRKNKASLSTQSGQVRAMACRHFFGNDTGLVKDKEGTFLGGNLINVYHIASIGNKLWVASTVVLDPAQTQRMVRNLVKE
jgi:hypothetical protein